MNKRFDIDSIVTNAIKSNELTNSIKHGADDTQTEVKKTRAPRQTKPINMDRYDDITASDWSSLPMNYWYRYELDGVLKPGGTLRGITNNTEGEFVFTFVSRMYGRSTVWRINSKNVTRLYKTKDSVHKQYSSDKKQDDPVQSEPVTGSGNVLDRIGDKLLFTDTETLRGQVESLDKRITNMETSIANIIKYLKKISPPK